MSKPIKLYARPSGPNPWKVVIILEELGIPYEIENVKISELKTEPYININPNGKVPAITDPNTDITLWETGAIIEYLIDTYDKEAKLTYTGWPNKYLLKPWYFQQMTGQGPYYGQKAWFTFFHEEKNLTSAINRYANEIKRQVGMLNRHLEGREYLVGDKCTFVDLAFVPWNYIIPFLMKDQELNTAKDFPHFHAWNERLKARPAVKKTFEIKDEESKKFSDH